MTMLFPRSIGAITTMILLNNVVFNAYNLNVNTKRKC